MTDTNEFEGGLTDEAFRVAELEGVLIREQLDIEPDSDAANAERIADLEAQLAEEQERRAMDRMSTEAEAAEIARIYNNGGLA